MIQKINLDTLSMANTIGKAVMARSNYPVCAKLKISGDQLAELKKYAYEMSEAFGLDSRIDRYQGKRPISFVSEDFDCLFSVLEMALEDPKIYPDHSMPEFKALDSLYHKLQDLYRDAFPGRGC